MARTAQNSSHLAIEEYINQVEQQGGILTNYPVVINNSLTADSVNYSGGQTITDASANALSVGANGTTNPVFNVDSSTTSVATGVDIVGAAAGSGVAVKAISSGTNESISIAGKGTGEVQIASNSALAILDNGTATATSGAATLSKAAGVVTSESLTTAALGYYTLTITNTVVAATDLVFASVSNGTNTGGTPAVTTVTPASGSVVVVVENTAAATAFNGTIKVAFWVVKAS